MVVIEIKSTPALEILALALNEVEKETGDLRPAFEAISSDFYKSNAKLIFNARPGKYADLKMTTKDQKSRKFGFVYPVLVGTGRLKESLIKRGSSDNITNITEKTMVLGTNVPYSVYLQVGTRNMVARPPIILDVGRRVFRWLRIINETVLTKAKTKSVK